MARAARAAARGSGAVMVADDGRDSDACHAAARASALRAGSPADLIVIDADTPWVLDPADLKSQCKNTPFDEAKLQGRVVRTIVAGRTVYECI